MPEDEVKVAAAAERLRTLMERIALLKAAARPPKSPESDKDDEDEDEEEKKRKEKENGEEDDETKGPATLFKLTPEEVEHRALQSAVLQEKAHALQG